MSHAVHEIVAEQMARVLAVARVVSGNASLSIDDLKNDAVKAISSAEFQAIDPYDFAVEAIAILVDVADAGQSYAKSQRRIASAMFELFDAVEEITDLFPGASAAEEDYWRSRGIRLDG